MDIRICTHTFIHRYAGARARVFVCTHQVAEELRLDGLLTCCPFKEHRWASHRHGRPSKAAIFSIKRRPDRFQNNLTLQPNGAVLSRLDSNIENLMYNLRLGVTVSIEFQRNRSGKKIRTSQITATILNDLSGFSAAPELPFRVP